MSQPARGFGLTVSPASTHLFGGHGTYNGQVTVSDPGSVPVAVTLQVIGLIPSGPHCTVPRTAPSWLALAGPRAFTLQPGHDRVVSFTAAVRPGMADSGAIVAEAVPAGHVTGAGATLNLSEGSRVTIGTTARCNAKPVAVPPPAQAGLPVTALGAAGFIAVLLGAVAAAYLRHRRRMYRS